MADNELSVSSSIVVHAAPEVVFAVLADPREHPVIDGSGSVRQEINGPERLQLGSRFGMRMRKSVGYRVTNRVVEFEKDRRIAWRNLLPAVWRYELEPAGESATQVTETFDYSRMPLAARFGRTKVVRDNHRSIEATLERLKAHVEDVERTR